jgi:peptidoglycan DL-endopeptidase LytE
MKVFRVLPLVAAALLGSSAFAATYTVKPGDTLYSIAQKANLEPAQLMKLNKLGSSTLQVGQKMNLGGSDAAAPAQAKSTVVAAPKSVASTSRTANTGGGNGNTIRAAASHFLNIRYMMGGTGGRGIDCSGFTRAVFQRLGVNIPRTARAQFGVGSPVSRGNLRSGDLVFFNTLGRGVSHVGLYLGNGEFANANSYHGRTIIEPMTSSYWATRYVGARRVL